MSLEAGSLTIGRLATAAGVNVETVRYYQRIGLLERPVKPMQGYRKYTHESVARIQFIKRAQQLGFNLKAVQELILLGDGRCADVMQRAQNQCAKIDAQIKDLQVLRRRLHRLIQQCQADGDQPQCPIVGALSAASD